MTKNEFKNLPLPNVEEYITKTLDEMKQMKTFIPFNWFYPDFVSALGDHASIVEDYVVYNGIVWRKEKRGMVWIGTHMEVCKEMSQLLTKLLSL